MPRRTALGAVAFGALGMLSRRVWADNPGDNAQNAGAPPAEPEEYIGVAPGSGNKNPLPKPESGPPKLVWTGFQPSEAGGRVFLQTTQAVTYDTKAGGKRLFVTLRNCRIHLKNNERHLNTSFFDTPVASVSVRQRRQDIEVTIGLKSQVATSPRVQDGPDGTKFVVLDFPAATQG